MKDKETKKITVEYTDGSVKEVDRGVVFSVYEEGERLHVQCDGIAGSNIDEVAVVAIVARIAKEMGITDELYNKAEVQK